MSDTEVLRVLHDRLEKLIRELGDHETNRVPLGRPSVSSSKYQ